MRSTLLTLAAAGVLAVLFAVPAASSNSSPSLTSAQIAQFAAQAPNLQAVDAANPAPDPPPGHLMVQPHEYDPAHTTLVQAEWSGATGCPNGAAVATYPAIKPNGTYSDPGCPTSDSSDHENDGLVLVKTGPTTNNAAAFAEIKGVKGPLTELGYDIRKYGPGTHASPLGLPLRRRRAQVRRADEHGLLLRGVLLSAAHHGVMRATAGSGFAGAAQPR